MTSRILTCSRCRLRPLQWSLLLVGVFGLPGGIGPFQVSAQTQVVISATDAGENHPADRIRTWTGGGGKTIDGTLLDTDGSTATIRAAPPKTATYQIALANLSETDREVIAAWVKRRADRDSYLRSLDPRWKTDVGVFLEILREATRGLKRPMSAFDAGMLGTLGNHDEAPALAARKFGEALRPFVGQQVQWEATYLGLEREKGGSWSVQFQEGGTLGDEFTPGGKGRKTRSHPSLTLTVLCEPEQSAAWRGVKKGTLIKWKGTIGSPGPIMSFLHPQESGYSLAAVRVTGAEPLR